MCEGDGIKSIERLKSVFACKMLGIPVQVSHPNGSGLKGTAIGLNERNESQRFWRNPLSPILSVKATGTFAP